MRDLKGLIPEGTATVNAIYAWRKAEGDAQKRRGYIGASSIGKECERDIWYGFRFCNQPDFDGRMYRLLERGDIEEPRMVRELRGIGCEVHEVNPENGKQFAVTAMCGHFGGHMDGCALGIIEAPLTWHVLEFKTMAAKYFAKLKKDGVKKEKPVHYAQMVIYMGFTKMDRALYMACNKDTDELYSERIRFDSKEFLKLAEKIKRILEATCPPDRISKRPDDFRCKFCDSQALCWGTGEVCLPIPSRTCRSCCHATPLQEDDTLTVGAWKCEKYEVEIPFEAQLEGCDEHLVIPGLIIGAGPVDGGFNHIEFEADNGVRFTVGADIGGWSTKELMTASTDTVFSAEANEAKRVFKGTVIQETKAVKV